MAVGERVREGDLLWTPRSEWIERTNIVAFTRWLKDQRGLDFDVTDHAGYNEFWQWSATDLEGFWGAIWDYFRIDASVAPSRVLGRREMPGAEWFPGARLNYAEHILRGERPGEEALLYLSETQPLTGLPWETYASRIRTVATKLRQLGVRPGQRVVGYLPNIPEAMVAMVATTSIGAIWAGCAPEFGWRGASDRFGQLEPTVLFAVDGYRYGGRAYDRRDEVRGLVRELGTLEHLVYLPVLFPGEPAPPLGAAPVHAVTWDELLAGPAVPAEQFTCEQVPFDHPLWVLFSSGTTGLPKAITHSHGGILIDQMKLQHLVMDLSRGDRLFFFTTTSWMMWNFVSSAPLLGIVPILYDGNPTYPELDVLWRLAQDSGANNFGASPAFIELMARNGIVPKERYEFPHLRQLMPAGSPVSPQHTAWFYRNVKEDLWVSTGSGGTDCCTGFVGGMPTLPVYAGEMQARSPGVAAYAYNDDGEPVVNEVGELVLTEPMPSMPVFFWGDENQERYRDTYFSTFPGMWRHGDFFRVNERGGCFVLGRSDAVLNRAGVRIGTAEIYRALEGIDEIVEAVVINIDQPDGTGFMPLFVALREGCELYEELKQRIRTQLRREYSPRHVPDDIIHVPDVPRTVTGKKMEVPVRRILMGTPVDKAVNRESMANPEALDAFIAYARVRAAS
jgi:acetoacetyl-CoA synthetase